MKFNATLMKMIVMLAIAGLVFLNNPAAARKTDGGPAQSVTGSDGRVERLLEILQTMEDLVAERKQIEDL